MTKEQPFLVRLFRVDQPFEQMQARVLAEGETTIGRDPAADWTVGEGCASLSRIHCSLLVRGDRIFLCDRSTNGTYLAGGERAPREAPVELRRRDALRVGDFTLLIDRADEANPAAEETLCEAERAASPVAKDWTDEPPPAPRRRDASLVEAFCEGAKLDVSVFSSEDPADLMRRVGAIYQQTILGLAALMAERARAKAELKLDGTTIGAAGNNPFKWAPTRRLAEELLRPGSAEFKSDAEAVRASFADLSLHLTALAAGAEAAAEMVMDELSPRAIEAEVGSAGSFLRSRGASCWEVYARRHAALRDGSGAKSLGREALAEGYARRLGPLAG